MDRSCVRGLALGLAMAAASGIRPAASQSIIDEAKIGVLAHDVGIFGTSVEGGADFVGELLFKGPGFYRFIGSPRIALGASVNTGGHTDYLYLDIVAWQVTLWQPRWRPGDGVFVGLALGGAVHDGELNHRVDDNKALGTRGLYHIGLLAGYQITPVNSVEIYYDHLSNANASSHNPGLNNIGVRVGFKF